jgi:hypothetical protein
LCSRRTLEQIRALSVVFRVKPSLSQRQQEGTIATIKYTLSRITNNTKTTVATKLRGYCLRVIDIENKALGSGAAISLIDNTGGRSGRARRK